MVVVAQLVRASVCGTEGRGFEPHLPPRNKALSILIRLFLWLYVKGKKVRNCNYEPFFTCYNVWFLLIWLIYNQTIISVSHFPCGVKY